MSYLYMLDTNIVSSFMRTPKGPVQRRALTAGAGASCVSIITAAELRFGATKVESERLQKHAEDAFDLFPVVPFEPPADAAYAEIRAALEHKGTPIGPMDLLIAAHALALNLTLVTANHREFSRIAGLRVENWLD
jgi:tRNA(fMet)-specific endonuclease VapC